jgi:hypothetical protein
MNNVQRISKATEWMLFANRESIVCVRDQVTNNLGYERCNALNFEEPP